MCILAACDVVSKQILLFMVCSTKETGTWPSIKAGKKQRMRQGKMMQLVLHRHKENKPNVVTA